MGNFQDDNHAIVTGALLGTLMKAGVMAYPDTDEEGNYTSHIHLRMDMGGPELTDVEIKVLG